MKYPLHGLTTYCSLVSVGGISVLHQMTYAMSSGRTGYTISNNTTNWFLEKAFTSPANSLLTFSIYALSSLSRDAD